MSAIVTFNNLDLEVLEYKDTWSLSDRQVAEGFGVTQEAVRKQRTQGATEYIEGVHYYYKDMYHDGKGGLIESMDKSGGGSRNTQKMVFWTKKGIITLGFKLNKKSYYKQPFELYLVYDKSVYQDKRISLTIYSSFKNYKKFNKIKYNSKQYYKFINNKHTYKKTIKISKKITNNYLYNE